ncbi:hypothetical protein [Proteiniphilum sp. UBA5384]|uniref:hypothetical protein n=1 Tax=Proteiniphilum sp. UBA5384 TaxID=1947279 RepID=UPI0025FC11BC|nr:hypothetical protein [Proteiniphilum sp. UBA5384]
MKGALLYVTNRFHIFVTSINSLSPATGWKNDWMPDWAHANPAEIRQSGDWTILSGKIALPEGEMLLGDSYRRLDNGLLNGCSC